MRLNEFYYSEDNKLDVAEYDDTRRPRLTLRHLNRMRRNKDRAAEENELYLSFLPTMYAKGNSGE